MASKHKKKSAKSTIQTSNVDSAVIQVTHDGLTLDAEGRLKEIPELLELFEKLRIAIKKHGGKGLEVSAHPHIELCKYGARISEVRSPQMNVEIENRYHSLPENLHRSWSIIVTNAQSERPLSIKVLGITEKEMAILKVLGQFEKFDKKFDVKTSLVTQDGQVSYFPRVTLQYLSDSKGETPDSKKIEILLVGIDVDSRKQLLVRLEKSHWIRLNFTTYAQVCEKLPKGVLVKGLAEVIDGVWVMQNGELIDAPRNMELPF